MLSTSQIQKHLTERRVYMPGWRFVVYDGKWEGPHLVITTVVPDSQNPGETTTLDVHCNLPPMETYEQLDQWMLWRLGRIATHEVREFYRDGNGRPIDDPHAEFAERDTDFYCPRCGTTDRHSHEGGLA